MPASAAASENHVTSPRTNHILISLYNPNMVRVWTINSCKDHVFVGDPGARIAGFGKGLSSKLRLLTRVVDDGVLAPVTNVCWNSLRMAMEAWQGHFHA